jgi:hypothetical protein
MADSSHYLKHLANPHHGNWREHLGDLHALNPMRLDALIQMLLRERPMYKSTLEVRLCDLIPSAKREHIRWMLDFKFGCTCRQLLRAR